MAKTPVKYSIFFPNYEHHEAEVEIEFSELSQTPLEIRMSRTSPGRYALHEFSKNIYNVRITDDTGNKLDFTRPNLHQWTVSGHKGTVKIAYTIFGDLCDGTYLAIDRTHAHLNIPATFMWASGLEDRPIEIAFHAPKTEWKIATQLFPTESSNVFTAPNLQYFMDSPTEISDFQLREWQAEKGDTTQTFRLAIHHDGTAEELDAYTEMVKAVVDEHIMVFGEAPDFDNSIYTFIADYLPFVARDAMEHRNSTVLTNLRTLEKQVVRVLGQVSHEFFHIWNIERIRPKSLEPFDFEHANMSGELWFGEGFTSYYEALVLKRAGIITIDKFGKLLTRLMNTVLNAPGSKIKTPVQMSQYAPFVDAGKSIDPKNLKNTYISYYPFGAAIGLGLDLTLRQQFPEISLDDYMRAAWQKFGKSETPYTNNDLLHLLAEVTGDSSFAGEFFKKYVYGHELQDYRELLAQGGLLLQKGKIEEAWLGTTDFDFKEGKMKVTTPTKTGTPLYAVGVDKNDIIFTLDRDSLKNKAEFEKWLKGHKPGEVVQISYESRGETKNAKLTLQENAYLEVVPFEHESREVTPEVEAFRQNWLGTKTSQNINSPVRHCPTCRRSFAFRFEFCKFDGAELGIVKQ